MEAGFKGFSASPFYSDLPLQGNLQFESDGESVQIGGVEAVSHLSELTGTEPDAVRKGLLYRTVATGGGEVIEKAHAEQEACFGRDAFAKVLKVYVPCFIPWWQLLSEPLSALLKALYERLFSWIVGRINHVIQVKDYNPLLHGKNTVIGVLDIYGFEIFDNNRLVSLYQLFQADVSLGNVKPLSQMFHVGGWLNSAASTS